MWFVEILFSPLSTKKQYNCKINIGQFILIYLLLLLCMPMLNPLNLGDHAFAGFFVVYQAKKLLWAVDASSFPYISLFLSQESCVVYGSTTLLTMAWPLSLQNKKCLNQVQICLIKKLFSCKLVVHNVYLP